MFKTQLSFTLLFKSNVVTVRRAAVRALHTLLLARNMTAVVRPSSALSRPVTTRTFYSNTYPL